MKYQSFKALIELIKRYRAYNDKDYNTVVIVGLEALGELRSKCVKTLFDIRDNKQEYFYGSRIILESKDSNCLAVAYEDKLSGVITDITEITEEAIKNDSKQGST